MQATQLLHSSPAPVSHKSLRIHISENRFFIANSFRPRDWTLPRRLLNRSDVAFATHLLRVQDLSVQLLNESLHAGIKKTIMTIDDVCIFGADDPNRVVRAPQALAPFILKDLFR
ncbi:MAG: hypothetical protein JNN16_14700 [Nitrospira sp.]|nr:hypothetical protein [Nitrospira sp.]